MTSVTIPSEQAAFVDKPETSLLDENVQLVALVTFADSVTWPPDAGSVEGEAVKFETVGGAGGAIVGDTYPSRLPPASLVLFSLVASITP